MDSSLFLPLGMTLLFLQYIVYIWRKIERLRQGEIDEKALPSELADVKIGEERPRRNDFRSFELKGNV